MYEPVPMVALAPEFWVPVMRTTAPADSGTTVETCGIAKGVVVEGVAQVDARRSPPASIDVQNSPLVVEKPCQRAVAVIR